MGSPTRSIMLNAGAQLRVTHVGTEQVGNTEKVTIRITFGVIGNPLILARARPLLPPPVAARVTYNPSECKGQALTNPTAEPPELRVDMNPVQAGTVVTRTITVHNPTLFPISVDWTYHHHITNPRGLPHETPVESSGTSSGFPMHAHMGTNGSTGIVARDAAAKMEGGLEGACISDEEDREGMTGTCKSAEVCDAGALEGTCDVTTTDQTLSTTWLGGSAATDENDVDAFRGSGMVSPQQSPRGAVSSGDTEGKECSRDDPEETGNLQLPIPVGTQGTSAPPQESALDLTPLSPETVAHGKEGQSYGPPSIPCMSPSIPCEPCDSGTKAPAEVAEVTVSLIPCGRKLRVRIDPPSCPSTGPFSIEPQHGTIQPGAHEEYLISFSGTSAGCQAGHFLGASTLVRAPDVACPPSSPQQHQSHTSAVFGSPQTPVPFAIPGPQSRSPHPSATSPPLPPPKGRAGAQGGEGHGPVGVTWAPPPAPMPPLRIDVSARCICPQLLIQVPQSYGISNGEGTCTVRLERYSSGSARNPPSSPSHTKPGNCEPATTGGTGGTTVVITNPHLCSVQFRPVASFPFTLEDSPSPQPHPSAPQLGPQKTTAPQGPGSHAAAPRSTRGLQGSEQVLFVNSGGPLCSWMVLPAGCSTALRIGLQLPGKSNDEAPAGQDGIAVHSNIVKVAATTPPPPWMPGPADSNVWECQGLLQILYPHGHLQDILLHGRRVSASPSIDWR